MKVSELKKMLEEISSDSNISFSIADDDSEDPHERWFTDSIFSIQKNYENDYTVLLVAESNLKN